MSTRDFTDKSVYHCEIVDQSFPDIKGVPTLILSLKPVAELKDPYDAKKGMRALPEPHFIKALFLKFDPSKAKRSFEDLAKIGYPGKDFTVLHPEYDGPDKVSLIGKTAYFKVSYSKDNKNPDREMEWFNPVEAGRASSLASIRKAYAENQEAFAGAYEAAHEPPPF